MTMMTNQYLVHHGIKGQKWGIRRFQNPDGTLTKAGQKRYARAEKVRDDVIKYATAYKDYATKNAANFEKKRDAAKSNEKRSDNDRWAKASYYDADQYQRIIDHASKWQIGEMDKALIKKAEKWVKNAYFVDADYADYYQNGQWKNYLLNKDRLKDFE